MAASGQTADAQEGKTLGLQKKARPDAEQVRLGGRKLRCGTVPWRFQAGTGDVELLLIERLNEPGSWAFPAGTLDPGEEPSRCAMRETDEEAGAVGTLGCFLGVIETEKQRNYFYPLHVDHVRNAHSETWVDEHSGYLCDGQRSRRWFSPDAARPLLRKEGPRVLDAFLAVPPECRSAPRWRRPAAGAARIYLHGQVDYAEPVWRLCRERGCLVAPSEADNSSASPGQQLALAAAGLWEADAAILVGPQSAGLAGLALGLSLPSLLLLRPSDEAPALICGSSLLRVEVLEGSDESSQVESARLKIESFLAALS